MKQRRVKCIKRGHDITRADALDDRGACVECRRITDRERKRKLVEAATHCTRGHRRTEENTRIATRPNGVVMRTCITCHMAGVNRASRAKKPFVPKPTPHSTPRDLTLAIFALYDKREHAAPWEREALTQRIAVLQRMVRPA